VVRFLDFFFEERCFCLSLFLSVPPPGITPVSSEKQNFGNKETRIYGPAQIHRKPSRNMKEY
jgi:hypothetical protein